MTLDLEGLAQDKVNDTYFLFECKIKSNQLTNRPLFVIFVLIGFSGRGSQRQQQQPQKAEELYPSKDKSSPVARLGKKKFPDASSKNLWFVVFYDNEDMASQQVKPTIVKLAEGFKGTVKVGAVNCGSSSSETMFCEETLGTMESVPGYAFVVNGEVIPYHVNGNTSTLIPTEKALHEFIMEHMPFSLVRNINRLDQIESKLIEPVCESKKVASILLLTDKYETSALYASIAYSHREEFTFGESRAKNLALAKEFGVKKYPMLVALIPKNCKKSKAYTVETYSGQVKGDQISKWVDSLNAKYAKR